MDSFTSRLIAVALPTLGIVFSGQYPDLIAEPQSAAAARAAEESPTLKIHDPVPVRAVSTVKLQDEVEQFLDQGETVSDGRRSSELRIKTSAPWIADNDGKLLFINRLPEVEDVSPAPPSRSVAQRDSLDAASSAPAAINGTALVNGTPNAGGSVVLDGRAWQSAGGRSTHLDKIVEARTSELGLTPEIPEALSKYPRTTAKRRPTTPLKIDPVAKHPPIQVSKLDPTFQVTGSVRDFYREMSAISQPAAAARPIPKPAPDPQQPQPAELRVPEPRIVSTEPPAAVAAGPITASSSMAATKTRHAPSVASIANAEKRETDTAIETELAAEPGLASATRLPLAEDTVRAQVPERVAEIDEPALQPDMPSTAMKTDSLLVDRKLPIPVETPMDVPVPASQPTPPVSPLPTPEFAGERVSESESASSSGSVATASAPKTFFDAPVPPSTSPAPEGATDVAWSPVDIRTIEVEATVVQDRNPIATTATYEDKVQAQNELQLAFELVQRRAPFSARARFIEAMRIVARSLDEQSHSREHSKALRRALKAYEEANDFFPRTTRPGEEVNLHVVIGSHDTRVLENADPARITPRQALREYLAYAEQEFAAAFGEEELASQALYGLARLESGNETTDANSAQVQAHRSLTLHQTALLVDDANYAAANELGVLLARYGKYEKAIEALQHSVRVSPQPTAWKNLASVYGRMGRLKDARMANNEADRALASASNTSAPFAVAQPRVQWVDANTFASISPRDPHVQVAAPQPSHPVPATRPTATTASKNRFWSFNRKN